MDRMLRGVSISQRGKHLVTLIKYLFEIRVIYPFLRLLAVRQEFDLLKAIAFVSADIPSNWITNQQIVWSIFLEKMNTPYIAL